MKLSECSPSNQRKMRVFQLPQRRQLKQTAQTTSPSTSFYSMWDEVARFAKEIRASEFMSDMIRRRDADGSEGVMGALDCATLYGLTRWLRPMVLVESGGFIGMSSAFILKARRTEALQHRIERRLRARRPHSRATAIFGWIRADARSNRRFSQRRPTTPLHRHVLARQLA